MNVKIIQTVILNCYNIILHLSLFQVFTQAGSVRGYWVKLHKSYESEIQKAKEYCGLLDKDQLKTKKQASRMFYDLLENLRSGRLEINLKTKSRTYRLKKFMLIRIE